MIVEIGVKRPFYPFRDILKMGNFLENGGRLYIIFLNNIDVLMTYSLGFVD